MSRPDQPPAGKPPAARMHPGREAGAGSRPAASAAGAAPGVIAGAVDDEEEAPPAPWHFKLLLFATAGYLVYRLIWFVFWLTGHAWHG